MVDTIYIEQQVREHPRALAVMQRFKHARVIEIERYSEVFNSHGQNFRLQKQNPSLILAHKSNARLHSTPAQYETGGGANYYFSHMLNCLYDCRYCFLQGMFQSANYLLFVNFEDFVADIASTAEQHGHDARPAWFFSGYDCDSLAYDPVTGFAEHFLAAFEQLPNAVLELRTKSTQIRSLLARPATPNVVVAYSLSPPAVASELEVGAPGFEKRVDAIVRLQQHGWRIGLRFDPVIWHADYQQDYAGALAYLFERVDAAQIDSVTLGGFRLPRDYYKKMQKLYPEHWLFAAGLNSEASQIAYRQTLEQEVLGAVETLTRQYISQQQLYVYPSYEAGPAQQQGVAELETMR
ncbi:MAG: DNA photolyase [Gammaproteobacteria bacterium]|nr:DNA photolyase [Gammaproteobacteria bacterium]